MNECIYVWIYERMNDCMYEWMIECMNDINEYKDECMNDLQIVLYASIFLHCITSCQES